MAHLEEDKLVSAPILVVDASNNDLHLLARVANATHVNGVLDYAALMRRGGFNVCKIRLLVILPACFVIYFKVAEFIAENHLARCASDFKALGAL